jgi:hypothetical protein
VTLRPLLVGLLAAGEPPLPFMLVSADRGDAVSVRVSEPGEVLVALDDVDDSPVPTAALTPLEALRVAAALMHAAREAAT